MLSSKRTWILLATFLFLNLLIFSNVSTFVRSEAQSAPTKITGSFNLQFQNYAGQSSYTIDYQYPSVVNVGQNFSVTVTVFVDQLTNLKLYLFDWGMQSTINSPAGVPITQEVAVGKLNDYLYQGSHWGPVNVTIPVTAGNFSISSGSSYNTSVTLNWIADVWYDTPYNWHFYENQQHVIGNLTLTNIQPKVGGVPSTFYYLTIAAIGVAIAAAAIFLATRGRNPKQPSTISDNSKETSIR